CELLLCFLSQLRERLSIHAKYLLRRCVRPSRKKSALRRCSPVANAHDSRRIDARLPEKSKKRLAGSVVANRRNWDHLRAERSQIIRRVRTATWNQLRLAILQDQNRTFPRH